ncbi:hypothetical protein ARMGADRAFT_1168211 [Armillaria gallica]|uniref:Uncharacterized protein n=1 Tax=Armillaria gallica TaxID=47427 RepID=A0A2H3DAU5_ARMGA|nr:hypothetical protein ARMGADRAFT_1168211 [Armillaria gallica]
MEILVYLEAFSNSTNKKGRTSQYLPLMSPCGDPWTSPTRTSPYSGLPKRLYRPFVQFPNLCARYAFCHRRANDIDCGWYLRWIEDSTAHIAQLFPLLPSSPRSLVQLHTITMLFNVNVAAVVALALAMSAYTAPSLPNSAAPALS